MRKEYTQARFLARVQIQVLQAHDEVKMATLRLRLREDEDDNSVDALLLDELEAANAQNSGDKFLAFSSLSRIKGQLRYLKVIRKALLLVTVSSFPGREIIGIHILFLCYMEQEYFF